MQEPTEYEMLELALTHLQSPPIQNQPSDGKYIMAAVIPLILFFSSITILVYAGVAKGTEFEKTSPLLSTCFSAIMLILECVSICYNHHEQYAMIPSIMKIMARIQIFHLIVCGSFVPYVNTSHDYATYDTWIHVITVPLILCSIFPFLTGVFRIE